MAFYTTSLAADQWMWCIFLGIGSLLWGQVLLLFICLSICSDLQ